MPTKPWSNNPYAPKISSPLYFGEKVNFAGIVMSAMGYGIVIILFFRCMGALLNPVNRKEAIKWPLVIHTVVMFLFVTVFTTQGLYVQSLSYVDNRDFTAKGIAPGPFAYQFITLNKPVGLIPTIMIYVNTWLADGLLLYRCYVIYAMNYWVIAVPFLMYLASIGMTMGYINQIIRYNSTLSGYADVFNFGTPFYSISLALCVLLTLMIVARLALHNRNIKKIMGPSAGAGGVYKAISTMIIESYALYVVNFILFIGTWGANNPLQYLFFQVLAETQAIAPFLIVLRVANRTAMTKESVSPSIGSIRFRSRGKSTSRTETTVDGGLVDSTETAGETTTHEICVDAESSINEVPRLNTDGR